MAGAARQEMRIVSYNILDGGAGRAEAIAEVIAARRPDVVALVEATDAAVIDVVARRLEMDVLHAPGNSQASALLARWPVRESINHAPLHASFEKSLLEATVVGPAGREWTLFIVHLHARATEADEEQRMRELDVLLKATEPRRAAGRPHLLCGDFNANAPYQRVDPAKCKPRTRREWDENGGGLPRRAVQRLLDAGYVDTLRELHPADAERAGSFTTEFPGQRVDYVFAFGMERTRLKEAWVDQSERARGASDHFPVGLEIDG